MLAGDHGVAAVGAGEGPVRGLAGDDVRALAGVKPQPQLANLTLAANPISTLTYYRPMCVHAFRPRRVGALLIDAVRVYMYTCIYLHIHTDIPTHMYIYTYRGGGREKFPPEVFVHNSVPVSQNQTRV